MGIRITDQPGDQHTQNPPPEQDPSLADGKTRTVASVTVDAPAPAPTVLRGTHHAEGFCLMEETDIAPIVPRTSKSDEASLTQSENSVDVKVSTYGWVRRETGATERIGALEDQIVRKLPPRWTIAPTSVTQQFNSECNKSSQ